jgi:hypothetical protein
LCCWTRDAVWPGIGGDSNPIVFVWAEWVLRSANFLVSHSAHENFSYNYIRPNIIGLVRIIEGAFGLLLSLAWLAYQSQAHGGQARVRQWWFDWLPVSVQPCCRWKLFGWLYDNTLHEMKNWK